MMGMSAYSSNSQTESSKSTAIVLTRKGAASLITASVANLLILYISLELFTIPSDFVGGVFGPMAVIPVIANTAIAVIGATGIYALILKISNQPNRAFSITAVIFLILSFGMLASPHIADAPTSLYGVLAVMHIVTAAIVIGIYTRN